MTLDPAFLARPIAHRGLHGPGVPENSRASFEAAIANDYGIELDLQLSADGVPMVFHDYDLDRMTSESGLVRERDASALGGILLNESSEGIPTLAEVLNLVDGRVPLLIETKSEDQALGRDVGKLEEATAKDLQGYAGPVAVMSFNPHSVACFANMLPNVPRGITTSAFRPKSWPEVPAPRREELALIPDYHATRASFISHGKLGLEHPRVEELRADGATILCWTIKSSAEEAAARRLADNITFEGYLAP